MKTVTRYISDSGFEFDTVEAAERENEIFARERALAKACNECIYVSREPYLGFVQLLKGEKRWVTS